MTDTTRRSMSHEKPASCTMRVPALPEKELEQAGEGAGRGGLEQRARRGEAADVQMGSAVSECQISV